MEKDIAFNTQGSRKGKPVTVSGKVFNQFAIPGRWIRGNLHCHLERLGKPEWPSDAVKHYHRLGYNFIAGMDHDRIVRLDPYQDLFVVPGAEISGPFHFLAFGIDGVPETSAESDSFERSLAMIRKVKEMGGITILAHPFKTGYSSEKLKRLCDAGLDGIEVVNSSALGKGGDMGRADQIWHQLLREGRYLIAAGGDDAHAPRALAGGDDPEMLTHIGWTGILAKEVSPTGIIDALRGGRTYASEGPELQGIGFSPNGKLTVNCSPCVACHFRSVGGGYGGSSVFPAEGQTLAEQFVYDLALHGYRVKDYIVIVLQDGHGRRAWASPLKINVQIHD